MKFKKISSLLQKRQIASFNSYRRLKNIKVPTLILHGKKDILLPPGNAELLAEKIFGAKLIYFENSAHMIFMEEPAKFIEVVLEFLKG